MPPLDAYQLYKHIKRKGESRQLGVKFRISLKQQNHQYLSNNCCSLVKLSSKLKQKYRDWLSICNMLKFINIINQS